MKDFSAFLDMRRYKNWAHKIGSLKYLTIWIPVLALTPNTSSFQGVLRVSSWTAHELILVEVDGKCRFIADTLFCMSSLQGYTYTDAYWWNNSKRVLNTLYIFICIWQKQFKNTNQTDNWEILKCVENFSVCKSFI